MWNVTFLTVVITDFITRCISTAFVFVEEKCALRVIQKITNSMKKISGELSDSSKNNEKKVTEKRILNW